MAKKIISRERYEHFGKIGRAGAFARLAKHGNPGTAEGRRKGGLNSLKTHRQKATGFTLAKDHRRPAKSSELAEFLGILIGDGHLSKYQFEISTNSETDLDHAKFIMRLGQDLFGLKVSLKKRKREKAVSVKASSVNLVKWLNNLGMPIGNKLSHNLSIPDWVLTNRNWQKSFIRGLFDTDGCLYLDTHKIKGKIYKNIGWTLTSYSAKLRQDIVELLINLGFKPTLRSTQKSVYLRRKNDIDAYFRLIGTSNKKHLTRYRKFIAIRKDTEVVITAPIRNRLEA